MRHDVVYSYVVGRSHSFMLDVFNQAIESRCEPQSLFDRIICLGWYDGPLEGICSHAGADFRYDLADDADALRYRVFRLARLPEGSVARFMDAMYRFGQLADGETPPSPMWVPMWRFPTPENQTAAEQLSDAIVESANAPSLAFCWDFDEARVTACRAIGPDDKPNDWFVWLGLDRIGERIDL